VVVGPRHEICIILDKHVGILNAVREVIPNHSSIHRRWCTRYLAQNLIKHDVIKENFKLFEEVCRQTNEKDFKKKLKDLERRTNEKGKKFLKGLMDEKEKWALAYDKGGNHYGYMTSNMAEIFNSILRGVRSLSITAITSFTFYKCNEWFVKWLLDAQMVQTHHSDYVVAPNIYLDIKRYEARAQGMHATCFDIQAWKYEVLEGGGTTSNGEHRRAKRFAVNLSENTCTCGIPQLIHVPYPHIIVVCNHLGQNFYVSPFMATYNTLEALVHTWSPRFVPFLDEKQWEPYDSPRYVTGKP
jgi:hypothetical protein